MKGITSVILQDINDPPSGHSKQFLYTFRHCKRMRQMLWRGHGHACLRGQTCSSVHAPCGLPSWSCSESLGSHTPVSHRAMSNLNCWTLNTTHPNAPDVMSAISLLHAWSGFTSHKVDSVCCCSDTYLCGFAQHMHFHLGFAYAALHSVCTSALALRMLLCKASVLPLMLHNCCFAQLNNFGPPYLVQIDVVTKPEL